jgi:putative ABC transport system ATP-binding protein
MENVSIPFVYSSNKYTKSQITEALQQVGLGHRLNHLPRQLSGGEMQRAAIARALATNPSLILADEPTGNLDHQNGIAILKLFQNLNAQGVTIVLVTHDEFVAKHCQRIIRMMDGKIIGEESPWP